MRIPLAPALLFLSLLSALACPAPESSPSPSASASVAASPSAPWSRKDFSPTTAGSSASEPVHDGAASGPIPRTPSGPSVLASSDPAALDEIVAAAPKVELRPTGADGGTALGGETGLPEGPALPPEAPSAPARKPRVTVGEPSVQPGMASSSIERAARAQIYWNLVQRCRDRQGNILPHDTIRLRFGFDRDGHIDRSSIIATPIDARFVEAAHCMQRELSKATFRAPAATRGQPGSVDATVPSVD